MNQLELHKRIEEFFKSGIKSAVVKNAKELIINNDAKRFFFSQADELWLDWLWKEGFLDKIKSKAKDLTRYSFQMPELEYLTRISEKTPEVVTQFIKSIKISKINFNPEVVDRFLLIINKLPANQIKMLTSKIRDEKWIYLMRDFRKSGYDFKEMIKKLVDNNENNALLELAQAILVIKSKSDIDQKGKQFGIDDPFYIRDLDASGIFLALIDIEESYIEKALQAVTEIMTDLIKLTKPDETKVFNYSDLFTYDIDFFTLKLRNIISSSYREDIKSLIASVKELTERDIAQNCKDVNKIKKIIHYVDSLPSSDTIWRLRLFALAQCPKAFKQELRDALFKLFEVEKYFRIMGETEYEKTLKIAFPYLSKADQRTYVSKVLKYFSEKIKLNPDQKYHKHVGWKILSCICDQLTLNESMKCEIAFDKKCDEKYEPKQITGQITGGTVSHKSPVNLADYSINQIIANLKSEWTPKKLNDQYKDDDFLKPRGAEGLGDALKEDIKLRTDEYLKSMNLFFDRDNIDPNYLYSLLRGIEEILRNKQSLNLKQIDQLFDLFKLIRKDGEKIPFKKENNKSWLADWIEVHIVITNVLLYILENKNTQKATYKKHREEVRDLISYLLTIKDSPSKEQEKPEYGDPYHVAINSVRGRAFETFVVFIENDGKTLADDTKDIYKKILLDDSLAVRFVIGRYLASFYFRDKKFIADLFPEIFPKSNPDKKDIYLASWEGYLSNTLYNKLFNVLKEYYSYAITLDPKYYTQRKYINDLDELLAIHLALAYSHLGFSTKDKLFLQFWDKQNTTRHKEFISFIGSSCLSRNQAGDEWLAENNVSKEKLIKFWDWILDNKKITDPKVFSSFGLWINPDKEILDDSMAVKKMAQTLAKSNGEIDWDYGLLKRLPKFAEKNKGKTLEIISSYLLDKKGNLNKNLRLPMIYQGDIKEALMIIYNDEDKKLKENVVKLINILIEKGSSIFWELKEIIK